MSFLRSDQSIIVAALILFLEYVMTSFILISGSQGVPYGPSRGPHQVAKEPQENDGELRYSNMFW